MVLTITDAKSWMTEKEISELERKLTTGENDINQRDITDDTDLRNIICDLIREVRALHARKDVPNDPLTVN
jgi:hypothetical protein